MDGAEVRERFGRISSGAPEALFVFGSISEDRRNRMTVWSDGEQLAFYDKVKRRFHVSDNAVRRVMSTFSRRPK